MNPLAVIIGAGRTGRGFVARLAASAGFEVLFLDKSAELVDLLNQSGTYTIRFFTDRPPESITDVRATRIDSPDAIYAIAASTVVFTAIGEKNLPAIGQLLTQAALHRQGLGLKNALCVVTCENGSAPGERLRSTVDESVHLEIGEAAVFCSTIEHSGGSLDIDSESYDELPYDERALPQLRGIPGLVGVQDFRTLLLRKIYTYNCISACIAYLGALKGFTVYADAANDPDIRFILGGIMPPLNRAISERFGVDRVDQQAFSDRALAKFANPNIRDDITRNAQDVPRKLGPHDRLIAPALMVWSTGGQVDGLALVIAAALYFGANIEQSVPDMDEGERVTEVLASISELPVTHPLVHLVTVCYAKLHRLKDWNQSALVHLIPSVEGDYSIGD